MGTNFYGVKNLTKNANTNKTLRTYLNPTTMIKGDIESKNFHNFKIAIIKILKSMAYIYFYY